MCAETRRLCLEVSYSPVAMVPELPHARCRPRSFQWFGDDGCQRTELGDANHSRSRWRFRSGSGWSHACSIEESVSAGIDNSSRAFCLRSAAFRSEDAVGSYVDKESGSFEIPSGLARMSATSKPEK
jgi:hypothetical protein